MSGASGTALRVVEVGSGIAGAYCGWLLQQMGAKVIRVGTLPAPEADANGIALALAYYAAEKQTVEAGEATDAIATADLVITDD